MQCFPHLPYSICIPYKQTVPHGIRVRAGFYSENGIGMQACGQKEAPWEVLQGNAGDVRNLGLWGLQNPIPSNQSHHYAVK